MLWTILIVVFVAFLYFGLRGLVHHFTWMKTTNYYDLYTQCSPLPETIINIDSSNSKLCTDGTYYLPSLDMIVSPQQVPYINACQNACQSGYSATTNTCFEPEENDNYQRCLINTQPVGCSSLSNPVAFLNSSYYYVNNIGAC